MTPEDVARGIAMLKDMCDPRGHELLDEIGAMLVTTIVAVEKLERIGDVDGHRVAFDPHDNTQWSKRAELRSLHP